MHAVKHSWKSTLVAWCLLGVATPLGAEIAYRATVLPLVLEGTVDHLRMNDQGQVFWSSSVVVGGSGIHRIYRHTTNIYSLPEAGEAEGSLTQIISPGTLIDINSSGHFVTSGKDAGHLWTGAFTTLPHPSRPRVLFTRLSENDSVYGTIFTSPDREEGDGIHVWSPSGISQKLYGPWSNVGSTIQSGPNTRGTTLVKYGFPETLYAYYSGGALIPFEMPDQTIWSYNPKINNKDQVTSRGGGDTPAWIYLPTPDYGLPAGLNVFDQGSNIIVGHLDIPFDSDSLFKRPKGPFTSVQDVWILEDGEWEKLVISAPAHPEFGADFPVLVRDITKSGKILASAVFEGLQQFLLLERYEAIRATVTVEPKSVPVGETVTLSVRIENSSDDPYVLSGVFGESFRILTSGPHGLIQLENPPPTNSLLPGETFTQIFPFKTTVPGKLKFSLQAVGFFADDTWGLTRTLISDEVQMGGDPLKIEFEVLPKVPRKPPEDMEMVSIVNMNVQEDTLNEGQYIVTDNIPGEESHSVISPKVKLIITNVWEGEAPVTASIQGLDPRARDKTALGARVKALGQFPMDLGSIAFGESVEREFDLDIRDDGRFDFKALATAVPDGTTDQYNVGERGAPIAVGTPYPVEIELKFVRTPDIKKNKNGAFFMKPGSSLRIIASVWNTTSNSTLNFFGIETVPQVKGNAFGGILTSLAANALNPPVAHDHEIEAGSSVVLSTTILTDPIGAPSGLVSWELPEGKQVVLIDDETGIKTELSADDILITGTLGSWLGDDLTIKVFQDYSLPPVPVLTLGETIGNYGVNAVFGMGHWVYDSFVGLGAMSNYVLANPLFLFRAMGSGYQSLYNLTEMAAATWENMSDEERDEYISSLLDEVLTRSQLYFFTRSVLTPEESAQLRQQLRDATYVFFSDVEDAYASNDPLRISTVLGKVSGSTFLEVATSGIPTPKFTKFTKAVEAVRLATNTKAARFFTETEKYLRRVKGPISLYHAGRHWGIGGQELQGVQKILKMFGMKGYARERSSRATHLIEVLKEALVKPEKMKPKGISEIDSFLLGEERMAQVNTRLKSVNNPAKNVELDGITAIFKPESDEKILGFLAELPPEKQMSPEAVKAILERAQFRREEYGDYIAKFREWRKDGIPVDFNYSGNVAHAPGGTVAAKNRNFDFVDVGDPGNPIYVPMMADDAGKLKYITGDVDWIHFSWLDGTPLDEHIAGALYFILSRCCGLQHGETISWFNKGQTIFKGKVNQLSDYIRGEKALLEVTGDSLRAVRVNPELTMFAPDGRNHLIFFDQGTKVLRQLRDEAQIQTLLASVAAASPARYLLLPGNWFENASGAQAFDSSYAIAADRSPESISDSQDSSINGRDWSFQDADDALMLRKDTDGPIEFFDGTDWLEWNLDASVGKIAMTPITTISDHAYAGDTLLEIFDLSLLGEDELKDRIDAWFQPGHTIVIAPGKETQEIHVIKELGSLILENPLQFDHPAGTFVSVIPANLDVPDFVNEDNLRILYSEQETDGNEISITWSSVSGEDYILESSETLESASWTPLDETVTANSTTTRFSIALPANGNPVFYRVRRSSP
ncbi:MAG: hypothetical protein DRP71_06020 [Verrucomicrobia bacterium]|nr:MAG: hypothetical protein DRP71_06020 [Verrucomicrobiota bacterium]